MTTFSVRSVPGIGEVEPGTDLARLVAEHASPGDGDILVVTSKVVSKAEGRLLRGTREDLLLQETDRVVARRGPTTIVRTRLGLVMAAAGIDASNVRSGWVVLLPEDPDGSARRLRDRLAAAYAVNVGVVVSDTSGRAWRAGQTDVAIGVAGLQPLEDLTGRRDEHGNLLQVTTPALADEIAAAGDLAKGKLSGRPVAVVSGLGHLVLPPGQDGPGAGPLIRPEQEDLFGYGAREAVLRAVLADDDARGFGATASPDSVALELRRLLGPRATVEVRPDSVTVRHLGPDEAAAQADLALAAVVARAHGWLAEPVTGDPGPSRFRPRGAPRP